MSKAEEYFKKQSDCRSGLKTAKKTNTEFLSTHSKEGLLRLKTSIKSKTEYETMKQSTAWNALVKTPKKLEDIQELRAVRDAVQSENTLDEDTKFAQIKDLDAYTKNLTNRYLLSCLAKSIGPVSVSTFDKKVSSIVPVWKSLRELDVPDGPDLFFGILLHRFNKNVFGKTSNDVTPTQLVTTIETFVGLCNKVASSLMLIADQGRAGSAGGSAKQPAVCLGRSFVNSIQTRILFLVEKLLHHGHIVDSIDSPFISIKVLDRLKLKVFKLQLLEVADSVRSAIQAKPTSGNKVLSQQLKGWLESGAAVDGGVHLSNEQADRVVKLISYFKMCRTKFLGKLNSEPNKLEFGRFASTTVSTLLDQLPKYHRTSLILDKKALEKLRVVLN